MERTQLLKIKLSKVILIISEERDISTDLVIEYIIKKGKDFFRINFEDTVRLQMSGIAAISLEKEGKTLVLDKINSVWLRRARLPVQIKNELKFKLGTEDEEAFNDYLEFILNGKSRVLGSITMEHTNNKLKELYIANKCGFKTPLTIITSDKETLLNVFNCDIICKEYKTDYSFNYSDYTFFSNGTVFISKDRIKQLPDKFPLTLFQAYIDKIFEVRVYFFNSYLFPMAIFSQKNEKTKVDFRNYDDDTPNRAVPYVFNAKDELVLRKYIRESGYTTGSIDIIVTKSNELVFLEVNPSSQFDWLNKNCNYQIEKEIANYLTL
jgi:hypothetical protein